MKAGLDRILHREQAEYLDSLLPARDPLLAEMEHFAQEHGHPIADAEVAQFMRVLLSVAKPKRIIEVGTNIGYSVVVMARACPDAVIETIELNREILAIARGFVERAGVSERVVFHEGAALEVLKQIEGQFDFAFIDCVKSEYLQYFELLQPHLTPGAAVVADNVLWKGLAAKTGSDTDASTEGIREYNRRITRDSRFLSAVIAVGDGLGFSVFRG